MLASQAQEELVVPADAALRWGSLCCLSCLRKLHATTGIADQASSFIFISEAVSDKCLKVDLSGVVHRKRMLVGR